MHISKVKLHFYLPCEVKCGLQNRVSTYLQKWLPGIAKTNMPVWRVWKMSLCPNLPQDRRNASWMKEKTKLLPLCLFLVPHLLPHLLLKWWPSHLQSLIPKGMVRLARASGKTFPWPLDELTMLLPMTSLEASHPSLLTNWSIIIFISLCSYFTQLLLLLIEFFTLVKSSDFAFVFRLLENPRIWR